MSNFFSLISIAGLFLAATNLVFSSLGDTLSKLFALLSGAGM